jgi:hypothetical protein
VIKEKALMKCQVSCKKMDASEPLTRLRKDQTLSKPECSIVAGISKKVTCLLILRQPEYKWHELATGFYMERVNLPYDANGKYSSRCTGKIEIQMHEGGAEHPVLVMKFL